MSAAIGSAKTAPGSAETGTPQRARIGMKKAAMIGFVVIAALGAGRYGYGWWTNGRFIVSTDDAYVGGDITAIAPHEAGFVAEVAVVDNQHVRAGQLLVRLDASDFEAARDHARATVEARKAELLGLQAQRAQQLAMIEVRVADVRGAGARLVFAHIEGARYAALAQSPAGSRQAAERARAADQESAASTSGAVAGLEAARRQLDVLSARIEEAQATVRIAEADLRTADLDLGYTEIRSPVDGYVGNRAVRPGAYVSRASYLLSVIPAHGLWVDANFKEDQLSRMTRGQAADVVADVAPGVVFHGRVDSLAPGTGAVFSIIPPENATGNFTKIVQRVPVRVMLDADGATLSRLRPGLSAIVSVDLRTGH